MLHSYCFIPLTFCKNGNKCYFSFERTDSCNIIKGCDLFTISETFLRPIFQDFVQILQFTINPPILLTRAISIINKASVIFNMPYEYVIVKMVLTTSEGNDELFLKGKQDECDTNKEQVCWNEK